MPDPDGPTPIALRGPTLTFVDDPFLVGACSAMHHEPDAIVAMAGGKISHFGPADSIRPSLPHGTPIKNCGPDTLMMAGFIDSHVHFPQTPMIGANGYQLLDWLDRFAFPTEQHFIDPGYAREVAKVFLRENLRNGITTASVFSTVYPQSVDALFEEAEKLGLRLATGKVLMDRNAPAPLLDTPQSGYEQSKALIRRWHGRGRLMYAISPRFAPSSTDAQLEAAGALWKEHPDCYMQTHISENQQEIAWVKELFPGREDYLDVYAHHSLCGPRALFGHGIHLTEPELHRMHASGAAITHCPTSNFFLGSGHFDIFRARDPRRPVRVGLGTDLGAGTTFSILGTLGEAYKAAQLNGQSLSAAHSFYLATKGTAQAMYLDDKIGNIAPGMEADLIVLDLRSTPLIDYRMRTCEDLEQALFIQMTMADDRAIKETYVAGRLTHSRERSPDTP
jgi:guanine deaminase